MTTLDPEACYRALVARDARFDGRFFVGVRSTGVFCRPVCPATTARREQCAFFPSAAAADEAGFRPCLRCRPETAPTSRAWLGTGSTVARGLALIDAGELDGEDASVDALADRLGVGARHLRRLFEQHLGASPLAVASTRRLLFAKQLVHETSLGMGEIAIASGFGSLRRFNEAFRARYGRPPSALRRAGARDANAPVMLRLRYRPPFDFDALLGFFRYRALAGLEDVGADRYRRVFRDAGGVGALEVRHDAAASCLVVTVRCPNLRALPGAVARVRRAFDLDADVAAIGEHLAADPVLRGLVSARPGLRVPGAFDGFELAIRAVLGQQITVAAARDLGAALVGIAGEAVELDDRLRRAFPTPAQLLAADLGALKMPGRRRETLRSVARAAIADPALFAMRGGLEENLARLRAIPGVGDWTAHYVALRGVRDPDAFPETDRGLERGYASLVGREPARGELARAAERWRPFRGYAAQHLWSRDGVGVDPSPIEKAR